MNFEKFGSIIGLALLVRSIIAVLTAVIITVMPVSVFFTTAEDAATYTLLGDEVFDYENPGEWSCGFAKSVVTPQDISADTYYIAGYLSNNPAQGVLDDMYARAVYLDDNTGRGGVAVCAIDCVGISRKDINDIRQAVIESGKVSGIKSINVAATHSHSAVDTQGLWGEDFYKCGRNEAYMEYLKQKAAETIINAYQNRKNGELFIGEAVTDNMQMDCRTPITYDENLSRIRFDPADGSMDTYIVNFACHAELLGKRTTNISADFPAYMIKEIERVTASENIVYINGAIGGMISAAQIKEVYNNESFDCEAYMKSFGKELGEIAMGISVEEKISPIVNVKTRPIKVICDNTMLVLARFLGVLNNDIEKTDSGEQAYILSEVSYLELGDRQVGMFLIPGEIYPELENGEFLSPVDASEHTRAEYKTLSQMTDCKYSFVVGLCNDELGYIIPDNDYMLHEWLPYFNIPKDDDNREHYEETNSVGVETAATILGEMDALILSAKG